MKAEKKSEKLAEKLTKLEEISRYFEQENVDIDDAISKYEEGVKLAAEIKKQLTAYELKITEIKEKYTAAETIAETEVEVTEVDVLL